MPRPLPAVLFALLALLLAGCATTQTEPVAAPPVLEAGDRLVVVGVASDIVGLDETGLQGPDARLHLRVLQFLEGGTDVDGLDATIHADAELPPELRSPRRAAETVVRMTLEQQGDGLTAVEIHRYDLRKHRCFACGRQLQGLRIGNDDYSIIRWYCPEHGYRDVTMEEL
jgi:hypothetical protein